MLAQKRRELVAVPFFRGAERARRSALLSGVRTSGEADEPPSRSTLAAHLRQMFGLDPAVAREHDRRAEALLELAHVQRPVVKHECPPCVERQSNVSRGRGTNSSQQIGRDEPDLLAARSKRWQIECKTAETREEIGPEFSFRDERIEVAVTRRHEAYVDADRLRRTDRYYFAPCSTRKNAGCAAAGKSPISSRNNVPWCAARTKPGRSSVAPEKAPFL